MRGNEHRWLSMRGMRFQLWLALDRFKSGSKAPHPIMCFLQIPTPPFNPRCFPSRNSNLPPRAWLQPLPSYVRTDSLFLFRPPIRLFRRTGTVYCRPEDFSDRKFPPRGLFLIERDSFSSFSCVSPGVYSAFLRTLGIKDPKLRLQDWFLGQRWSVDGTLMGNWLLAENFWSLRQIL